MASAKFAFIVLSVLFTSTVAQSSDVDSWHFNTYFFKDNREIVAEATAIRKALRERINNGLLDECSLNQVKVGVNGPHPFSQFEMCCNKTSLQKAQSWMIKNHGSLSVLLRPLTNHEVLDYTSGSTWIGQALLLDLEYPEVFPILPKPRPCPVYPIYSDEIADIIARNAY